MLLGFSWQCSQFIHLFLKYIYKYILVVICCYLNTQSASPISQQASCVGGFFTWFINCKVKLWDLNSPRAPCSVGRLLWIRHSYTVAFKDSTKFQISAMLPDVARIFRIPMESWKRSLEHLAPDVLVEILSYITHNSQGLSSFGQFLRFWSLQLPTKNVGSVVGISEHLWDQSAISQIPTISTYQIADVFACQVACCSLL